MGYQGVGGGVNSKQSALGRPYGKANIQERPDRGKGAIPVAMWRRNAPGQGSRSEDPEAETSGSGSAVAGKRDQSNQRGPSERQAGRNCVLR